ncbi:MAG: rhodanese-like domain-containing protein [Flavobacteriales bacterium]|nr:rhodanese-like domain-containing protein [Flavobacteriales bacterium]
MFVVSGCGGSGPDSQLSPSAFRDAMRKPRAQLVDVRTPDEFATGHLEGAIGLDWAGGILEQRMSELDKELPVLVYCASGRRSAAAASALRNDGFRIVYELEGGISAWRSSGLPVLEP